MGVYNCLWCKREFKTYRNKKQVEPKFCSSECYRNAPRKLVKAINASDEIKRERVRKSFEKYVLRKDGCWGWSGSLTKFGYGKTSKYFKLWAAHRASWFLNFGEIPNGKCVLHKCDNPICTNPDHLFLGDKKINNEDRTKKQRQAKGSGNGNSKLDEKKVKNIKNMLKKGISQVIIGKKFGIDQTQISNIKLGKTWRHVEC